MRSHYLFHSWTSLPLRRLSVLEKGQAIFHPLIPFTRGWNDWTCPGVQGLSTQESLLISRLVFQSSEAPHWFSWGVWIGISLRCISSQALSKAGG
jgi:hypothetical protein